MINSKSTALQNAYELIERGELEAAQEILAPLLESSANDATLWWVYAHAVRDSSIGQAALQRVLEIDPHYPGARELSQDLNQIDAPHFTVEPMWANESAPAANAAINIDEWEDLQPAVAAPQTTQSSRIGTTVLVAALLLLIVGGALIATGAIDINQLLSGLLPTPQPATTVELAPANPGEDGPFSIRTAVPQEEISPEATAQEQIVSPDPTLAAIDEQQERLASDPTVAAVAERQAVSPREPSPDAEAEQALVAAPDEPVPTDEPAPTAMPRPTLAPLPRAESVFVERVAQLIRDFDLDTRQAFLRDSAAGNTLVLQSCALPGTDFNAKVAGIMQAVVTLADEIAAELDAVAAGLLNCDDPGARLRIIGAEVSLIRDYASGAIDDRDFQRGWKQLG